MSDESFAHGELVAELAARIDASKHRFLSELRALDLSGEWNRQGFRSCAQWMSWRLGWETHTSREYVRTAHALDKLPAIDDALRRGKVSYAKVRAMTRVATPENEATLLEQAELTTASQLATICRKYATILRDGQYGPTVEDDSERRYVTRRVRDDGMVVITAVLHADEAERVWTALDRVGTELCRQAKSGGHEESASSDEVTAVVETRAVPSTPVAHDHRVASDAVAAGVDNAAVREAAVVEAAVVEAAVVEAVVVEAAVVEAAVVEAAVVEAAVVDADETVADETVAEETVVVVVGAVTGDAVAGVAVVGDAVVGDAVVGDAVVGDVVVGDAVVGDAVVGDAVVGDAVVAVVGDAVVGKDVVVDVVVGDVVVGDVVVGDAGVGDAVVGDAVVGDAVVGKAIVGKAVVGKAVVGNAVGDPVVGDVVVGDAVVGDAVVGDAVVGVAGDEFALDAVGSETQLGSHGVTSSTHDLEAANRAYAEALAWSPRTDSSYWTPPASWYEEDEIDEPNYARIPISKLRAVPSAEIRERQRHERGTRFDRANALVAMAEQVLRGSSASRSPTEVVVTISCEALAASDPECVGVLASGTCVPAETVRRLCCDAGIVPVLEGREGGEPGNIGNGGQSRVLQVGRKSRAISAALMRMLSKRDRTCTFPGCTTRVFLEGHHLKHWADGGATALENLCRMCSHHHRYVHEYGYSVSMVDGRPQFRDARGRAVPAVPSPPNLVAVDTSFSGPDDSSPREPWSGYDGTPVSYPDLIEMLIRADRL